MTHFLPVLLSLNLILLFSVCCTTQLREGAADNRRHSMKGTEIKANISFKHLTLLKLGRYFDLCLPSYNVCYYTLEYSLFSKFKDNVIYHSVVSFHM